jgi:hypothetical protein
MAVAAASPSPVDQHAMIMDNVVASALMGGCSGYPISSGRVIRLLRHSGNENHYSISALEKHYLQIRVPAKIRFGLPNLPESIIKVYTQTHIILHRLVVCVEFQLQIEKNNIL